VIFKDGTEKKGEWKNGELVKVVEDTGPEGTNYNT
jgi:hypothetical protein